ncbi:hypothetical protein TNCV_4736931 [Trichonephila clavipes]|nr:hypothetical protein TNCV_4736931 [Trichonephila clavipes]
MSVYMTLAPEVHEQMFRSGGQSDVKLPVLGYTEKGKCPPKPDKPCDNYVAHCCNSNDCGEKFMCCQKNCQFQCFKENHEESKPGTGAPEIDLSEDECLPYINSTTK